MEKSVTHFAHPAHELKFRKSYTLPRWCDICGDKLPGGGFSCRRCGFDVHEDCAAHPETLRAFFAHPWHDLALVRAAAACLCDLCLAEVPAGRFVYRCAPCGFDAHPRCAAQLRQTARSELHPEHSLNAVPSIGRCAACGKPCYVWLYRCGLCGVDLHIGCLNGAGPSSVSSVVTGMVAGDGEGGRGKNDDKGSLSESLAKRLGELGADSLINMISEKL